MPATPSTEDRPAWVIQYDSTTKDRPAWAIQYDSDHDHSQERSLNSMSRAKGTDPHCWFFHLTAASLWTGGSIMNLEPLGSKMQSYFKLNPAVLLSFLGQSLHTLVSPCFQRVERRHSTWSTELRRHSPWSTAEETPPPPFNPSRPLLTGLLIEGLISSLTGTIPDFCRP